MTLQELQEKANKLVEEGYGNYPVITLGERGGRVNVETIFKNSSDNSITVLPAN